MPIIVPHEGFCHDFKEDEEKNEPSNPEQPPEGIVFYFKDFYNIFI